MAKRSLAQYLTAGDDQRVFVFRRDVSSGMNSRVHASELPENQVANITNGDISDPGKMKKAPGSVLIGSDVSNSSVVALHDYQRQGYTDQLMSVDGTYLRASEGEAAQTDVKTDFTASDDVGIISVKESGLTPDDVIIVQNGTDNPFRFHKDSSDTWGTQDLGSTAGTGTDSPPKSTVMAWYGNRLWVLKNDLLYFSSAYPADYSSAFDTVSDSFRIPVGEERGLVSVRDTGLVVMGVNAIWGISPSIVPDPTADKPQPLVTSHGVVSKKGYVQVGDDIYFFAKDGLRSLQRTVQDKLQMGVSYPLSYALKDEYEAINWEYISRLCMSTYDNKVFITVPTGASTFSTWIYSPASNGFVIKDGWSPRCYAKHRIDGEQRLYYGKHGDGTVYRAWYGHTDEGTTETNGTAVSFAFEGRKEDLGSPLVRKCGGEVIVKALASGSYTLTVQAQFDDGWYQTLGTIDLSGNLVTFPVTFPVSFLEPNVVIGKFHIDSYGEWYQVQIKITNSEANTSDIEILEVGVVSYVQEYESEE